MKSNDKERKERTTHAMAEKTVRVPPELEDIVAQIGEFIEYWGFKNIHGRIWAHIFLSPEPLDAGDLIDRLGVSKALVSMSISDLLEYEVIQLAGKSDRGTVLYSANSDITTTIMNVLRKRERRMVGRISAAARLLKDLPEDRRPNTAKLSPSRVACLSSLIHAAEATLDGILLLNDVSFSAWEEFKKVPDPVSESKTADKQDDPGQIAK